MYKLKFTRLQNEIFRLFCIKSGEKLNQRDIAKLLRVSPTAVSKSLDGIKNEGLISIDRMKEVNFLMIQLNRNNAKTISMKRSENLRILSEASFIEVLEREFPGCPIVLFGSYSLGEDTIDSDIDVAIIGSKKKDIDLKKFERMFERKIILQFYNNIEKIDRNLRNSIINGIVLSGVIEI